MGGINYQLIERMYFKINEEVFLEFLIDCCDFGILCYYIFLYGLYDWFFNVVM